MREYTLELETATSFGATLIDSKGFVKALTQEELEDFLNGNSTKDNTTK